MPDRHLAGGRGRACRGHGLPDGHLWASDSVFDTSYAHDGMRHTFRGCLIKRGWSTKSYRALENRQWRLNNDLASSECRVGDYHLSGVRRTIYKGIRVVVFKYRFDYLVPC